MDNTKKTYHAAYNLTYHVVLVVKYRKQVLTEEMCLFLRELGKRLMEGYGGELLELNTDRDHLHMLIRLLPSQAPSVYICSLKTQFSKELHKHFGEEINLKLKDGSFWTASYYVSTTGTTNLDAVMECIEKQNTSEHKRKYEKTGRYSKKRRNRVPG